MVGTMNAAQHPQNQDSSSAPAQSAETSKLKKSWSSGREEVVVIEEGVFIKR